MGLLPEYCCAFLRNERGWWLLQLRPMVHARAPGQLTCFGGRREPTESRETCLRRELQEELGWCPAQVHPVLDLWHGTIHVASFFHGELDRTLRSLRTEAGHVAVLAPGPSLPGLPISPWHALAFSALRRGDARVEVPVHA